MIRVTSEQDGVFAPRMMSDRANAWMSGHTTYVFAGSRTSGGPQFFKVDLTSDRVTALGLLITYGGETECWYWTPDGRVVLPYGPFLLSVNVFDPTDERILIDIRDTHPGHDLWQPHSSDDGRTHSATVRQIVPWGKYPYVGTVVVKDGRRMFFGARHKLDESQVTRDSAFIVIKEKTEIDGSEDNRIIDLDTEVERTLGDVDGAIGHSDCGNSVIIGEANLPEPGRCVRVDLRTFDRFDLFLTWNLGYVSCRGGKCLHSDDTHLRLIDLQSGAATVLIEHGANAHPGDSDYYDRRSKASLSPCGRVATYMVNGSVYLLVLP